MDLLCARTRTPRQSSLEDSCRLDFNMLFDEGVASSSSSEEYRQNHREPCTYMYLRLLRRLCTPEDVHMRQVSFGPLHRCEVQPGRKAPSKALELVREALRPLGDEDLKQRAYVREAVQTALEQAGYKLRTVTSRRASGGNGVMCSKQTYFQLTGACRLSVCCSVAVCTVDSSSARWVHHPGSKQLGRGFSGLQDDEYPPLIVEPLLREAFQVREICVFNTSFARLCKSNG
eukprot:448039-Prorocentrum_minimum.AAC.2